MAEFRRVKFPVIFTRTANVYGPYQQRYRLIPKALYAAISNSEFYLDGDGSSIRSFIFMEDVARALLRILELGEPGETYHISTRESHNIREIIEKCFQIVGADFTKLVKFTQDRPGKDKNYLLNSDKLRVNLGWGDVVGLEEGLNATRNWIQKEFSDFSAQPQIYFHQK
jgi:dTDP-glucose 4,6-dehydratase